METIVIGGGMVGVSTALALQERGHNVILLDRREPGSETSYGNAGLIQTEAVAPYAIPMSIPRLSRIAFGVAHDVAWSPFTMHRWVHPLARYFWNSLPSRHAQVIPHYATLIVRAAEDHEPLIKDSAAEMLINRNGFLQAYRSEKAMEQAIKDARANADRFGVVSKALDGKTLSTLEPNLKVKMAGAIHFDTVMACTSPGDLVKRYAGLFAARGGRVEQVSAQSLEQIGTGWRVITDKGHFDTEHVVVALGPWSPKFLAPLGYKVPMILKRGYHQHFRTSTGPNHAFMDVENSTVMSPMKLGLRVLTGAELNSVDGSPNYRQIRHSARVADSLFGIDEAVESTPWRGARPCMPEMLPVIGRASRHKNLWLNFGHGHQGFTLGPTTGRLLADTMSGLSSFTDIAPYQRY